MIKIDVISLVFMAFGAGIGFAFGASRARRSFWMRSNSSVYLEAGATGGFRSVRERRGVELFDPGSGLARP